jgi:hypothetical protein
MVLLFADDQVITANSEDKLHISIHKLERVTSQYELKFSKSQTKTIVFKGSDPARSKIVIINNIIIEQINTVINKPVSSETQFKVKLMKKQ